MEEPVRLNDDVVVAPDEDVKEPLVETPAEADDELELEPEKTLVAPAIATTPAAGVVHNETSVLETSVDESVSKKESDVEGFLHRVEVATETTTSGSDKNNRERRVTVTADRKMVLLWEARQKRTQWLEQAPLPYRRAVQPDDPWNGDERLAAIRQTHASARLPAALTVLSHMYGLKDGTSASELGDRLDAVLESPLERDSRAIPSTLQRVRAELSAHQGDTYLKDYHALWTQLQDPSCAQLVQGMQNFVRKLKQVVDRDEIAARLKAYVRSTFLAIQSHVLWKEKKADERLNRALEGLIYAQCYPHLEDVLWTPAAEKIDTEWLKRLADLQFVTPQNLDITCLAEGGLDLSVLLKEPIDALQSVDLYFSAYDKLQRMLKVYHGVNAALTAALNRNHAAAGVDKKLPSADDVLPTIILVVLKAMPQKLHLNLQIVEEFGTPEYLRGEAGYAFTNVYGAVQFLQDLNMEDPKSLSITMEEFRKGLSECRAKSESKRQSVLDRQDVMLSAEVAERVELAIPPLEVRKARLRGEDVDLEWAVRWQVVHGAAEAAALSQPIALERTNTEEFADPIPSGFSRSYGFMTCRPEDIKMSDLPRLLSEYRMLVHTTETLLAERATKAKAERKASRVADQNELYARVREVDPSLLPMINGKKK